jgi:E3 ubiquitin-protein ligase synoviolin
MMEIYGIASLATTAAIILYYAHTANYHFFVAIVSATQSSMALLSLLNCLVVISYSLGAWLMAVVFGELRLVESENIHDKFWFTVMDTGLAMTIFRNELDSKFLLIFGFVLFLKVFHWILSYRIDYMDQNLVINWDFYVRMGSAWTVLLGVDLIFLTVNYYSYIKKGPDMMLVFSLEVAMLVTLLILIGFKFILNVLESRSDQVWDDKGQLIFYMELAAGMLFFVITRFIEINHLCSFLYNYNIKLWIANSHD